MRAFLGFPSPSQPPLPPPPATPYPCESITPDFFSFPSSLFLLSIVNFLFLLCCFYLQCPLSPPPIFTFKAPQLRSRPPRGGFSPLHALERLRRRGKECARAVDPPDIHSLHLRVPGGWQKRREKSNNQHQHANRLTPPGPRGTCMHFNYWSSHMIKNNTKT